jgi:hypothetical protein
MAHYHGERNHQGLDNRLLMPLSADRDVTASIKRRERLGGMLSYYDRQSRLTTSDGNPGHYAIEWLDSLVART